MGYPAPPAAFIPAFPPQTTVTWEGEQLVCVQKGEVPNRGWRHWLNGEKLHLVSRVRTGRADTNGRVWRRGHPLALLLSLPKGEKGPWEEWEEGPGRPWLQATWLPVILLQETDTWLVSVSLSWLSSLLGNGSLEP